MNFNLGTIILVVTGFLIINALIFVANSLGLILLIFPKIKQTLQDKSKLNSDGGISTLTPLKLLRLFSSRDY